MTNKISIKSIFFFKCSMQINHPSAYLWYLLFELDDNKTSCQMYRFIWMQSLVCCCLCLVLSVIYYWKFSRNDLASFFHDWKIIDSVHPPSQSTCVFGEWKRLLKYLCGVQWGTKETSMLWPSRNFFLYKLTILI